MNLHTSELLIPIKNEIELLIDRIDIFSYFSINVIVEKYDIENNFISIITPNIWSVDNCVDTKTRIRVYLSEGQLDAGEKLQVKLESAE